MLKGHFVRLRPLHAADAWDPEGEGVLQMSCAWGRREGEGAWGEEVHGRCMGGAWGEEVHGRRMGDATRHVARRRAW